MTTYYFPITSSALAHYMGSACLKASKYFNNKPKDIQDRVPDFLLLTDKYGSDETDCCLQIVLTDKENEDIIHLPDGWFLFEKPLPISRVVKIHFAEQSQMERTITNIRMSTAAVPLSILGSVGPFDHLSLDNIKEPIDCLPPNFSNEVSTFNQILGGLIMMRIVHNKYTNYSEEYISTLACINSEINKQLSDNGRRPNDKYASLFTDGEKWKTLLPYLNKTLQDSDIEEMACSEKQVINKNKITRKIELESLDKFTYILAILNSYGVGSESKSKKIDDLIIKNFEDPVIKNNKALGIALCYGYNRGYNAFNCSYGITAGKKKQIKFELDSQLDYYTIESVYQLAINKTIGGKYPYLDGWCPKSNDKQVTKNKDFRILDTVIIGKKKASVFSPEYWTDFFQTINLGDLTSFFQNYLPTKLEPALKDAQDEVREEYELIIHNIETENNKHLQTIKAQEDEISKLREELSKVKHTNNNPLSNGGSKSIVTDFSESYGTCTNERSLHSIIDVIIKYDALDTKELKKLASRYGITIRSNEKKIEIIRKIMQCPTPEQECTTLIDNNE